MGPEHDVAGGSPRLPDQRLWSRWEAGDAMSSEVEMGDFLYGLVRHLKPNLVVETGSRLGATSKRIIEAVSENGIGEFITCDPNFVPEALIWAYGQVSHQMTTSHDIRDTIARCDLLFSDSDSNIRPEEVSWLKPGAIAVVHDTYVHPHLGEFVKSQGGILFDTPRGFGMIRK